MSPETTEHHCHRTDLSEPPVMHCHTHRYGSITCHVPIIGEPLPHPFTGLVGHLHEWQVCTGIPHKAGRHMLVRPYQIIWQTRWVNDPEYAGTF